MASYGGKELAAAFRTVRGNTLTIAEDIPAAQYDFRPAPDVRPVDKLLVHMALSPSFALHIHGNKIADLETVNFMELMQKLGAEEAKPLKKDEILTFLKSEGYKYASFLEGLSDSFLAETVTQAPGMEPAVKTRFEMLLSPKEHEMHHRGQLMLIERMIGITPHLTREFQARMAAQAAQQPRA